METYKQSEREKLIGHFFHFYQPERQGLIGPEVRLPELGAGVSFRLLSSVNYKIAMESYLPVFLHKDMDRVLRQSNITFFPSLRYWFEEAYPSGDLSGWSSFYTLLMVKIRSLTQRQYHLLSGPPLHIILPLLPDDDIRMLLRLARTIDTEDFTFTPAGLFCPEMAVDERVVRIAAQEGFSYIVLRDFQVTLADRSLQSENGAVSSGANCVVATFNDAPPISVVLADSKMSADMAFNRKATVNADAYLSELARFPDRNKISAIDGETIGHHIRYLDLFFARMHEILEEQGFIALEVKKLISQKEKPAATINASSWSCAHGFGRWTGECVCDNPSEVVRHNKRVFTTKLRTYNDWLNEALNETHADWRTLFSEQFFLLRKKVLTGKNYVPALAAAIDDDQLLRLITGKFAVIIGLTSCGTFFAHDNQVEKRIPQAGIRVVELLFVDWKTRFETQHPDLQERDEHTGKPVDSTSVYAFVDSAEGN